MSTCNIHSHGVVTGVQEYRGRSRKRPIQEGEGFHGRRVATVRAIRSHFWEEVEQKLG